SPFPIHCALIGVAVSFRPEQEREASRARGHARCKHSSLGVFDAVTEAVTSSRSSSFAERPDHFWFGRSRQCNRDVVARLERYDTPEGCGGGAGGCDLAALTAGGPNSKGANAMAPDRDVEALRAKDLDRSSAAQMLSSMPIVFE